MRTIGSAGISPAHLVLRESNAGVSGETYQNIKDILGIVVVECFFRLLKGQSMRVEGGGVGQESVKFPVVLEYFRVLFAHMRLRHSLVFLLQSMTFRQ